MPVPSSISDLSTTPSLNSPAGTESPSTVDDYLRTQAAFIRQVDDKATGTVKAANLAANGGSALVGFQQAGPGTVARTVESKLREIVAPADTGGAQATSLLLISGPADAHNYCANPAINQIAGGMANIIAGGGYQTSDNEILGATDYQTISGGYDNTINGCIASTISGGAHHNMLAGVTHGTIGGGSYNDIEAGDYGTIAGGTGNTLLSSEATIAGGTANTIGASSTAASIGGGASNSIVSSLRGTISGGIENQITGGSNATIGGGQGNVMSGGNSFVAGQTNAVSGTASFAFGLSNTVSAPYAAAWGRSNTVSKDYGAAFGYQAVARSTGRTAAGGRIAADGDAQYTDVAIKGVTTSDTNVYLTGADGNQFVIPFPSDNFAATVSALLTAVEPATGATKSMRIDALVKRIGGVNTLVGGGVTTTVIAQDAAASAWTVASFSLSTNNMRIGVAGDVGKTIRWAGKVTAVEVSF